MLSPPLQLMTVMLPRPERLRFRVCNRPTGSYYLCNRTEYAVSGSVQYTCPHERKRHSHPHRRRDCPPTTSPCPDCRSRQARTRETQVCRCPGCGCQTQTKAEDVSRRPRKDCGCTEGALGYKEEGCEVAYCPTARSALQRAESGVWSGITQTR